MKKHYLVYQITNLINGKIYIGIHSTNNINDGYLGSGTYLKSALKKYGVENFKKEILCDYNNPEDMIQKEVELVNREFICRDDVYNQILGGLNFSEKTISVFDKDGNYFRVDQFDPRYLNGELKPYLFNKILVYDNSGKFYHIDKDDYNYQKEKFTPINKNKVLVKDAFGRYYQMSKSDSRYLNGEVTLFWLGRKHTEETKNKIGSASKISQLGIRNSQYGTFWIHNLDLQQNRKIKKKDSIPDGWILGRKIKW